MSSEGSCELTPSHDAHGKAGLRGIYAEKVVDRYPDTRAAGVFTSTGESVATNFRNHGAERPPTPDKIKRFKATLSPAVGTQVIHYGKAHDPDREVALQLRHGMQNKSGEAAKDCLNPPMMTRYERRFVEALEKQVYQSAKQKPLGQAGEPQAPLPDKINPSTFVFGKKNEKDPLGAGALLNPRRSWPEIEQDDSDFHGLYVRSHMSYYPGEQARTKDYEKIDTNKRFGMTTPYDLGGRQVARTMRWIQTEQESKAAPIQLKRIEDYKERTQAQLGKTLDPNKDTRSHLSADHSFGVTLSDKDIAHVDDLLHTRVPLHCARANGDYNARERALTATARRILRANNWTKFRELVEASRLEDKEGDGRVNTDKLREITKALELPLDLELREQLFDYCDFDHTGKVPYEVFVHFINWKEAGKPGTQPDLVMQSKIASALAYGRREVGDTPRRVKSAVEKELLNWSTTNRQYNAGKPLVEDTDYMQLRRLGIPSVRTDLVPPRISKVANRAAYGAEPSAGELLSPNIFLARGIDEQEFLGPRHKDEIRRIFTAIGVSFLGDEGEREFEALWNVATNGSGSDRASLHAFRQAYMAKLRNEAIQRLEKQLGTPEMVASNALLADL